jgi:hypothetical protein
MTELLSLTDLEARVNAATRLEPRPTSETGSEAVTTQTAVAVAEPEDNGLFIDPVPSDVSKEEAAFNRAVGKALIQFELGKTDEETMAALGNIPDINQVIKTARARFAEEIEIARKAEDDANKIVLEAVDKQKDAEFEASKQFVEKVAVKNRMRIPTTREEIEKLEHSLKLISKEQVERQQRELPKVDQFKYPVFPTWIFKGCSMYDGYIKPICDVNSRYPEMMFVSGMAILLNYLGTKTYITLKGRVNGAMVNIIGRKGRVMKSSSVQDMFNYFKLVGIVDDYGPGIRNAEGKSLVWTAGSTEGVGVSAQRANCKNMILYFDELKTLSDKAGIEGSSMGGHLLTMLQSGKFANETKSPKGSFQFDPQSYTASVITCCTDRMFTKYWSKLIAFSDGLEDRATHILQPEHLKDVTPRMYVAPTTEQIEREKQLLSVAVQKQSYDFDDHEALASFTRKYGNRSGNRVEEWALGFAIQMGKESIDEACVERAIALETYNDQVKRYLNVREAETKEAVVQNQVIQILMHNQGRISIRELNKRMRPDRLGTWLWGQCYTGLLNAGITAETGAGTTGDPKMLVLLQVPERDDDD